MHLYLNNKENHYLINNLKEDDSSFQKEDLNFNINILTNNEMICSNKDNKILLNNKRKGDTSNQSPKKHTKFSYDNLKYKCKHLIIENLMKFINDKIYEVYEGNIDDGFTKKKLMKMNQSQKANQDIEFNKKFITKTLKEIFSQNITQKIKLYEPDQNKRIIDKLLSEKKEEFEKIFNLTFIECVNHFIGNKQIKELQGLKLFHEFKKEIINKYEKDGESYYENLKIFLKEFENIINRAKSRKKRTKKSLGKAQ